MYENFSELTGVLNIIQKKKSDGFDENKINELIKREMCFKRRISQKQSIRAELHDMGVEVLDTRQGVLHGKKID